MRAGRPRTARARVARAAAAVALAGALLGPAPAVAQTGGPGLASPADTAGLHVYLMTMGVGAQVWEKFGHNAIWIHDPERGSSIAYNYGMFDFRQEDFLVRFLFGRMWYWMAGFDALRTVQAYVHADRDVIVQELALTERQKRELRDFLEWNARDENRFYGYDYYRDNCSTRVRDAIDRVLGGQIRAQTESLATATTYRWHTARLMADDPLLYTGTMLALGQPTDQPISAWEEMFLPVRMMEHVRRVRVRDEAGRMVPLVASERVLYRSQAHAEPARPPGRLPAHLAAGLAGAVGLLALARAGAARAGARRAFGILAGGWSLLMGLAGGLMLFLWSFTQHWATYRNENVLQASLLSLGLAVLLPRLLAGGRRVGRATLALAGLIAAMATAGLLLKALPALTQHNLPLIALLLPLHLGVFGGAWLLARPETPD